ncbi:MAG: FG-GAP repeat protein [Gammaproteobacteria bacterium]|nr:FG-GAP repeat protein [Gammaproteobacteria bacterium]
MARQIRMVSFLAMLGALALSAGCSNYYSIDVNTAQKISDTSGNFSNQLHNGDQFGQALAKLGDLNQDGVSDIAVGAPLDDDNGTDQGALYILFMQANGQVASKQKISASAGNFTGGLASGDHFGAAVANIGDLNRDGFIDLAVGAPGDNDGGTGRGAVWILNLDAQGLVLNQHKISSTDLAAGLKDGDRFGSAVTAIGDLDGDGVADLAVGAPGDDDGGTDRGAVWILFMNSDGTVKSSQKISISSGNFKGDLHNGDQFGVALADMGDLDANGVHDLAVGAPGDNDGGMQRGAVWLLLMNRDGTVSATQKISQTQGQFDGLLGNGDHFGTAVTNLGDLNHDGIPELGVGAPYNGDGGPNRGSIWVVFLRGDHTVISSSRISNTQGNFQGALHDNDQFGTALIGLGDMNQDGVADIATGAILDSDGGTDRGAVWLLFMKPAVTAQRIDPNIDMATLFSGRGY